MGYAEAPGGVIGRDSNAHCSQWDGAVGRGAAGQGRASCCGGCDCGKQEAASARRGNHSAAAAGRRVTHAVAQPLSSPRQARVPPGPLGSGRPGRALGAGRAGGGGEERVTRDPSQPPSPRGPAAGVGRGGAAGACLGGKPRVGEGPPPPCDAPPRCCAPRAGTRRRHGQGRPQQAAGQDVFVRLLRADVPRGAQEEASRLLRQLRRVLAEVLGAVEGERGPGPAGRAGRGGVRRGEQAPPGQQLPWTGGPAQTPCSGSDPSSLPGARRPCPARRRASSRKWQKETKLAMTER